MAASKEVAQELARVNRDWYQTGRSVAWLMARAKEGDIEAQRRLEDVLKQREALADRRDMLEGRQGDVDKAKEKGEKQFQSVREANYDQAKHYARKDWADLAAKNPRLAGETLSNAIADLEHQLSFLSLWADDAEKQGDYETAAAFEADAQALSDGLRELRSLEGQVKDKDTVTGTFNARAMEAMMRGGGAPAIEKQQLEVQQQMEKHLKTLTTKVEKPSVVATD